jgi:23S rRNA (adenine2503-C2)-methyltransferase
MDNRTHPVDLLDLTKEDLEKLLANWGEPGYRVDQIWGWLYKRFAISPEEMTNLPLSLRTHLEEQTRISSLRPLVTLDSGDGETRKTLFGLPDGPQVEAVLMRYRRRRTLCISTQAGCAMGCPFCATGQGGFARNLSAGEIVAQVLFYARLLAEQDQHVTNIVFMGMGEPLANYAATWGAIRRLNDPNRFGLGARAMTLSTVGLVPAIRRMIYEPEQVGLAVSLHAPSNQLRNELVPINRRYPLAQLMEICHDYVGATHRRISFEYALMDGINDSDDQAHQVADLLGDLMAHINLIPLNPTQDSPYRGSSPARVRAFQAVLDSRHVPTTVRLRRGIDIQAGCGQLRARYSESSTN